MHWPHDEIAALSHRERQRWCREISKINSKLNDEPDNAFRIYANERLTARFGVFIDVCPTVRSDYEV